MVVSNQTSKGNIVVSSLPVPRCKLPTVLFPCCWATGSDFRFGRRQMIHGGRHAGLPRAQILVRALRISFSVAVFCTAAVAPTVGLALAFSLPVADVLADDAVYVIDAQFTTLEYPYHMLANHAIGHYACDSSKPCVVHFAQQMPNYQGFTRARK